MPAHDPPEPPNPAPAPDPVAEGLRTAGDIAAGTREGLDTARQIADLARTATDPAAAATALTGLAGSAASLAERALRDNPAGRAATEAVSTVTQGVQTAQNVLRTVQETAGVISGAVRTVQSVGQAFTSLSELLGPPPIPPARFAFASPAARETHWSVVEADVREGLSEVYEAVLDLASDDTDADPDVLLGASATFTTTRGDHDGHVRGIVRRVEHTGTQAQRLRCRVFVVPALWALSQRVTSQIFQDVTVTDVVAVVLAEGLAPFGRTVRWQVQRTLPTREYCVQYNESDLDFVRRLLSDEGIAFYFVHDAEDGKEILVMADANTAYPALATPDDAPLHVRDRDAATDHAESVRQFDWSNEMQSTSVVVRDYDFTQPELDLTRPARGRDARGFDRERFEYPAPLTLGAYSDGPHAYGAEDGRAQAELRRQGHAARVQVGAGRSDVCHLRAGCTFTLAGHGRAALNRRYLVTTVAHHGEAPEELTHGHAERRETSPDERYSNGFTCLPFDVPFRPVRPTHRPRVYGAQTARVVGPASEEIYTDHHGRIKVQFHWDREGRRDERSSCWVRVKQAWAGEGWGFQFIPRIGMEVVVDFLEGDPDRPLVTGTVYNGTHALPYPTDQHKTQSGIKTRSSRDSEGFNELRFEDAAGAEEIFVHAQKNLKEIVLHNHDTTIGAHQTNTVKATQIEHVGGFQRLTVKGPRIKTIENNETNTVTKNRTTTITLNESLRVTGTRTIAVTQLDTETFNAERHTTVNLFDSLTVTGRRYAEITKGNDDLRVTGHADHRATATYHVQGDEQVQLQHADHSLTLNAAGAHLETHGEPIRLVNRAMTLAAVGDHVTLSAAQELRLVCGAASVVLKSDGTIELNGAQKIALSATASSVTLEPTKITASAPSLTSSAMGTHEITGAIVKIN